MVADALAPCVARSSAPMILAMQSSQALVLRKDFNYLYHVSMETLFECKCMSMFPLKNLARKGWKLWAWDGSYWTDHFAPFCNFSPFSEALKHLLPVEYVIFGRCHRSVAASTCHNEFTRKDDFFLQYLAFCWLSVVDICRHNEIKTLQGAMWCQITNSAVCSTAYSA